MASSLPPLRRSHHLLDIVVCCAGTLYTPAYPHKAGYFDNDTGDSITGGYEQYTSTVNPRHAHTAVCLYVWVQWLHHNPRTTMEYLIRSLVQRMAGKQEGATAKTSHTAPAIFVASGICHGARHEPALARGAAVRDTKYYRVSRRLECVPFIPLHMVLRAA